MNYRFGGLWLSLVVVVGIGSPVETLAGPRAKAHHWRKNFAKAEAEARQLDRPLLVHFHASWCGPCRRMEAEVLNSAELQQVLADNIIAIKIDVDQHPDLSRRFNVQALPHDVLISPQGKVLGEMDGYQPQAQYTAKVTLASAQYLSTKQVQIAKLEKAAPAAKPADAKTVAKAAPAKDKPSQQVASAPQTGIQKTNAATQSQLSVRLDSPEALVGLEGFCPVTLWKTRSWKRGQQAYKTDYQGQTFYFAGAKERDEFKASPARYAPRLLGCDPVVLVEAERAIAGTSRYGAYFDGELYLFESTESRSRFKKDPSRYINNRQVLNVKQIQSRKA